MSRKSPTRFQQCQATYHNMDSRMPARQGVQRGRARENKDPLLSRTNPLSTGQPKAPRTPWMAPMARWKGDWNETPQR